MGYVSIQLLHNLFRQLHPFFYFLDLFISFNLLFGLLTSLEFLDIYIPSFLWFPEAISIFLKFIFHLLLIFLKLTLPSSVENILCISDFVIGIYIPLLTPTVTDSETDVITVFFCHKPPMLKPTNKMLNNIKPWPELWLISAFKQKSTV